MEIEIKPLTQDNIVKAAELLYRSWHESFAPYLPMQVISRISKESSLSAWEHVFSEKMSKAELSNIGAFVGGDLIGTITTGREREKYGAKRELWAMHVDNRWHRRGVGRQLFEAVMIDNTKRGIDSMALTCISTNLQAIRFYEAMGGIVQSGIKKRDGFEEVVILWKNL